MRKLLITTGAALLISPGVSAPVLAQVAQATQQQQQPAAKPAHDMNEVVCEKQEVIGSRLATQRICKTRAQWAEDRRADRMEIDRVQTQRGSCEGKACH